jgi:hypothetical protein
MFDPEAAFEAFSTEADRLQARLRSAALKRSAVIAQYRPLLLAARLRHPNDGALYARLVDLCERFTARVFTIEQRPSHTGEASLFRLAHDLYTGMKPEAALDKLRETLWYYAPDKRVRTTLESTEENWYARPGHKYFLYEHELSLLASGEELQPFTWFTESKKVQRTTEHILPQHPKADAACWWDLFSPAQHASLCHALGNLVLTLDNSSYSNKCFADKRGKPLAPGQTEKPCYAQGKLHQERQLAQYEEWTPGAISNRQKELADWALEHWAVASPEPDVLLAQDVEIEDEGTEEDAIALELDPEASY